MISERFKQMRAALGKTQTEFGIGIGVSRSVIKNIEYGLTKPNELFLNHLCEVYNIDRTWLETGEGDMFNDKPSEAEQLASAIGESPALQSLLAIWAQLSDENKAAFERFAADFADDYQQRKAEREIAQVEAQLEDASAEADQKQA